MQNCNVEDICVGKKDSQDQEILEVYGRKSPDYAVYRTKERVLVQFADEKTHNAEQRKAMAPLNPLRGEINGLLDSWRESDRLAANKRARRYARRGGDALIVAFEEDVASAQTLLAAIKQDILDERLAWARFEHLVCALVAVLVTMWLSWAAISDIRLDSDGGVIWRAACAGAVGAFFSIAIGIKDRSIEPARQRSASNLDAALRIVIGVVAAAVLTALVLTKAVVIQFGEAKLGGTETTVSKTVDKVPTKGAGVAADKAGAAAKKGDDGAAAEKGDGSAAAEKGDGGAAAQKADDGAAAKKGGDGAGARRADASGASKAEASVIPLNAGDHHWLYILLVGFIAGFLERLVPDFLARASVTAPPASQAPPVGPKRPANAKDGDPKDPGPPGGGGGTPATAKDVDPLPAEADADHCACEIELTDAEVTRDEDLPPASGGVAPPPPSTGDQ